MKHSIDTLFLAFDYDAWIEEAKQAMEEAHLGVCGAHQLGPKLHDCIKRMGYYWPTIVQDCIDYAKKSMPISYINLQNSPSHSGILVF